MSTFGKAVWSGGLKDGKGAISTKSGALKDYPYGFAARFEDGKNGTNPEELIGAAHAGVKAKTIALIGDGGAQLMIGELATAVEMQAHMVFVLMNDKGYGVIRNIQDAQYGGRHVYSNILTPDFALLCAAVGLPHVRVSDMAAFEPILDRALAAPGPCLIEVDMVAIGPFGASFAGPPAGAAGKTA